MNTVSINIEVLHEVGATEYILTELIRLKSIAIQKCRELLRTKSLKVQIHECTESSVMFIIEGIIEHVQQLMTVLVTCVNLTTYVNVVKDEE